MLPIGSKAPDFKLKTKSGKIIRLRDFYGKCCVIVSFFPGGFSTTEAEEYQTFLQHLQKAHELGAAVITISPKITSELRKTLSDHDLVTSAASDPSLEVCRNYHAFWLRGLGLRKITYVIDKNGFIRIRLNHILLTEKSWRPVMRILKDLGTTREMKGKSKKIIT